MIEVRADDLQHDLHVLRDQLRALEPARAGQDHEPTLVLTDQTLEERRVETVGVLEGIDHRVGGPQVEERCDVGLTRIEIDEERAAGGPLGQAHRQIGGDGGDSKPAFAGEHRRDAPGPTRRLRSAPKPQELLESGREVSRLDGTEQELDLPGTDDLDDEGGGADVPPRAHTTLAAGASGPVDRSSGRSTTMRSGPRAPPSWTACETRRNSPTSNVVGLSPSSRRTGASRPPTKIVRSMPVIWGSTLTWRACCSGRTAGASSRPRPGCPAPG